MARKLPYLFIALAAGIIVSASFSAGFFVGLENFFEDLLFSEKYFNHNEIVILGIEDESIRNIGQWPWPRKVFADALLKFNQNPPAAVGLDVIFSEPSRLGIQDDRALADALNEISYPVVMPAEAQPLILENGQARAGNLSKPLPIFENSKNVSLGSVNLISDRDNVVRRFPLAVDGVKAFAYELVKKSGKEVLDESSLSGINKIVYALPPAQIGYMSFWRILEDEDFLSKLKGKIVLIGATAADLHDEQLTSFSRGRAMSGVGIQASIINMLLSGYRLSSLDAASSFIWIFFSALLPALVFMMVARSSLAAVAVNVIFGFIYLILIILLFDKGIAVNLLHVNFSWVLSTLWVFGYRYFVVEKEKREIKNLFSKYVSKDVLNEILSDPAKVKLGGEEKEVTVFFSDIRGFTTISEKTTPKELVRILNKYFTAMTKEVLDNGGVLDKYIGDAIMAFWGAPIDDPDQAENALVASLKMLDKLKELNKELKAIGDPEINIGIGLYTGPAIVGNVGSDLRFDYTVMGDTVNVASRLEGLNKEYKTQIIIGETTKNKIKGKYNFKFLGSVAVKGRKEPLNIYTIESQ
ncbi:MAG: adenylate/guanylate cyclase domain-containing protein [Candidatus Harrisonbacteria bacterium]|nr:adenylate/guanylate cyclase domain-containing protein [Candidatus Harrisonbacteria bacterium]